jgi:hypothetical protein
MSVDYIRLGMPAPDRPWSGEDMIQAQTVLAELDFPQLPRYKSQRSGEVFARMTSAENLKLFSDANLPIEVRTAQSRDYMLGFNQILMRYMTAFMKQEATDSELVELLGATLRSTAAQVERMYELLPSIKPDDPSYEVRMQGVEQVKRGFANVVAGALHTLKECESYRASERAKLLDYMQDTIPSIVPFLNPGSRLETIVQIEKMQEDPALQELRSGLSDLEGRVKGELDEGSTP